MNYISIDVYKNSGVIFVKSQINDIKFESSTLNKKEAFNMAQELMLAASDLVEYASEDIPHG